MSEPSMPPLPEPYSAAAALGLDNLFTEKHMDEYAKAYAQPLLERIKELEAQNEAQKNEWLSWNEKRAALEADAAELAFLESDLLYWVDRAVSKGNANSDIEEAHERHEHWLRDRAALSTKEKP